MDGWGDLFCLCRTGKTSGVLMVFELGLEEKDPQVKSERRAFRRWKRACVKGGAWNREKHGYSDG